MNVDVNKTKVWYEEHQANYFNHKIDYGVYCKMVDDCTKEVGLSEGSVRAQFKKLGAINPRRNIESKDLSSSCIGVSEIELRKKFDVLFQIREAVKTFSSGKDAQCFSEAVFKEQIVKTRSPQFKSKAEMQEFEPYKGRAPGPVIYWGHPDIIDKLKKDGVLS